METDERVSLGYNSRQIRLHEAIAKAEQSTSRAHLYNCGGRVFFSIFGPVLSLQNALRESLTAQPSSSNRLNLDGRTVEESALSEEVYVGGVDRAVEIILESRSTSSGCRYRRYQLLSFLDFEQLALP